MILFLSSLFIIFLALIGLNAKLPNRGIFALFQGDFLIKLYVIHLCNRNLRVKMRPV